MPCRCLVTKFLRCSSVGCLLRVRCRLGTPPPMQVPGRPRVPALHRGGLRPLPHDPALRDAAAGRGAHDLRHRGHRIHALPGENNSTSQPISDGKRFFFLLKKVKFASPPTPCRFVALPAVPTGRWRPSWRRTAPSSPSPIWSSRTHTYTRCVYNLSVCFVYYFLWCCSACCCCCCCHCDCCCVAAGVVVVLMLLFLLPLSWLSLLRCCSCCCHCVDVLVAAVVVVVVVLLFLLLSSWLLLCCCVLVAAVVVVCCVAVLVAVVVAVVVLLFLLLSSWLLLCCCYCCAFEQFFQQTS